MAPFLSDRIRDAGSPRESLALAQHVNCERNKLIHHLSDGASKLFDMGIAPAVPEDDFWFAAEDRSGGTGSETREYKPAKAAARTVTADLKKKLERAQAFLKASRERNAK